LQGSASTSENYDLAGYFDGETLSSFEQKLSPDFIGRDRERDLQLFDLKFELIELKLAIRAVMSLWAQLKSEMP